MKDSDSLTVASAKSIKLKSLIKLSKNDVEDVRLNNGSSFISGDIH